MAIKENAMARTVPAVVEAKTPSAEHDHDSSGSHTHADACCHDHSAEAHSHAKAESVAPSKASDGAARVVFAIQKMDCPTEERLIRDRLGADSRIESMSFNLMQRKLTVHHRLTSVGPLLAMLKSIDMDPVVIDDSMSGTTQSTAVASFSIPRRRWWLLGVSGVAAISAEVIAWTTGAEQSWPVVALALLAIATGGIDTLRKGWIALRNFALNMNFLMSVAVIGAAAIGQWPEAAVVIFLFALAEMIEALSIDRARNAIQGLMAMTPEVATVQGADGQWREMPAAQVAVGTIVRVKAGERFALDGLVVAGQTTVNQAPITGESMPVAKGIGDGVFAGTINERGSVDYRATSDQGHSTLARIIETVQEAQGQRAPTQRFVDQFARYYIPAVFIIALLVALVPPFFFGAAYFPWIYKALVLLVIACPCALVISTPVTVVTGLAAAARDGILIKGGLYLEQARQLKALALDKTGTLTVGKPAVTDVVPLAESAEQETMQLAASLAARSDHPVSTAVARAWKERGGTFDEAYDIEALTGRGIKGTIGGTVYHLGNHRLVEELGVCSPALEARLDALEKDAKSLVVLCGPEGPRLIIAVADVVRETSTDAIRDLRALGVHLVVLTGDNDRTAQAIGSRVGVDDVRGNLLPEDKLRAMDELVARYGRVGMVGDGINDAPALAKSSIGFAMGAAGTDTALETADVALMDDDLRKIPALIRLSRDTRAILVQNITLALATKAIFFVLALTGHATLWMAVFADLGVSLIVVFNGLRLLRARGWRGARTAEHTKLAAA
ncbi:MAG: heavy metal translocating P-type ATPase [Burkholderiales bacterium]